MQKAKRLVLNFILAVCVSCAAIALLLPAMSVAYAADSEEVPYVNYTFNNSLTDSAGHSTLSAFTTEVQNNHNNISTSFGQDAQGPYYQWESNQPRGGGFTIDVDKELGNEYTIALKFSFNQTSPGWKKIIDYKNMASDNGFYFYGGGKLQFYPYTNYLGQSVISANQVVSLIVTRSSDGQFKAYIYDSTGNRKLDLDVSDPQGQAIPAVIDGKTRLGFFYDDNVTPAEATSGGRVYGIRMWDKAVDVDIAHDDVNKPEISEESKTMLRTVRFVDATSGAQVADAVVQKVTLKRSVTVNSDGSTVYGAWSTASWPAVSSPSVDKYGTPDMATVPELAVTADTAPSEVVVSYPQGVENLPESKTVTRTINYVDSQGNKIANPVVQSFTFTRMNKRNKVTGIVTNGLWSAGQWARIEIPQIQGYNPSTHIEDEEITAEGKIEDINVVYTSERVDQSSKVGSVQLAKTGIDVKVLLEMIAVLFILSVSALYARFCAMRDARNRS